jgi:hypothetical protein
MMPAQLMTLLPSLLVVVLATTCLPTTTLASSWHPAEGRQMQALTGTAASDGPAVPVATFALAQVLPLQSAAGRKLLADNVEGVLVSAKLMYKGKILFDRTEAAQVPCEEGLWEVPAAGLNGKCGNTKTGSSNDIAIEPGCEWL